MKTKTVKMLFVGTLEKKMVSNEELKTIIQNASGYEVKMKAYREYWISDEFVEENAKWINWDFLCSYQPLSTKLIEKHHLNINFDKLISRQKVSQKILLKFREQIKVDTLTEYQPLSEKFIERYHDLFCMYWANIVYYQKLSLQFLIDNKHRFDVEDLEGSLNEIGRAHV